MQPWSLVALVVVVRLLVGISRDTSSNPEVISSSWRLFDIKHYKQCVATFN